MKRRSVVLDWFKHGDQPIPAASRIGPLLITGGVHGVDRQTGDLPSDPEGQIRHMFKNLASVLEAGGATWDDVARVTVYIGSPAYRAIVNVYWVKAFPEEASRPARHTMINGNLPAKMHAQCDAIAFIESPN